MEQTYREQIIEAINELIVARHVVFNQILNLAMANEFSHWKYAFE